MAAEEYIEEEQWFKFQAIQSKVLYGYGSENEADLYVHFLNKNGRNPNPYSASPVSNDEAARLRLGNGGGGFSLGETLGQISED